MANTTTAPRPRCLCCGGTFGVTRECVCSTCTRDAWFLKKTNPGSDFVRQFELAKQGKPQACMTCGWLRGCSCESPDRAHRAQS